MTPGEAAVILSIDVDASVDEIDRAYRAHARRAHPDLLVGANHDQIVAAEAEFVLVTEARAVLHNRAAGNVGESPGQGAGFDDGARDAAATAPGARYYYDSDLPRTPYAGAYVWSVPRAPSSWLIVTWTLLMLGACAVSYLVGPMPGSEADLLLRLLPLTALSVLYAATGRQVLFVAAVVLVAVTVVMTFLLASFGSLLSIELVLVPFFGLVAAGRRRRRIREFDATLV